MSLILSDLSELFVGFRLCRTNKVDDARPHLLELSELNKKIETNHCCSLQLAVGRELFLFCNIFSKADGGQIAAALKPYVA